MSKKDAGAWRDWFVKTTKLPPGQAPESIALTLNVELPIHSWLCVTRAAIKQGWTIEELAAEALDSDLIDEWINTRESEAEPPAKTNLN